MIKHSDININMKTQNIKSKLEIKEPYPELYLIDADEKQARSIIEILKQKKYCGKIAIFGRENIFNRRALETLKINYLISPEKELTEKRKDTLKQRDSGLNHVTAKIAEKNNIAIVIDFSDIQNINDKKQKASRLSRIIQNIKICRKAKCKILIWNLTNKINKYSLQAFGFSLGMSSQQVSEAIKI